MGLKGKCYPKNDPVATISNITSHSIDVISKIHHVRGTVLDFLYIAMHFSPVKN